MVTIVFSQCKIVVQIFLRPAVLRSLCSSRTATNS